MAAARDTRVRLTDLLDEGYSISQAAGRLGMAKTTELRWHSRYLETGGLKDALDLGDREFRREERTGHCSDIVSVILLYMQVNYMPLDSLEAVGRLASP